MRDSDTYLAILDEGRAEGIIEGQKKGIIEGRMEELKKMILGLGQKLLGEADDETKAAITSITDIDRLEFLHDRTTEVDTWQELLQLPLAEG